MNKKIIFLILAVCSLIFLSRLNRDLLTDWDECVYAQYAKEMKMTGNFFTNPWNGTLVFEKPPLNSWLMQVPFLLGVNEFTARLPMVLMGLLLIFFVYVFAKQYFSQRVAIISSLLILVSEVLIVYMRRVNTDIGFTLFIFLGVYFWMGSINKKVNTYLSGLFFGLAVMIKGLGVAPFLLSVLITILIDFKKERLFDYVKMLTIFLLVIVPWHVYEYIRYGNNFLQVYFIEHILKRMTNSLDFHFEGRLFYLKLIYSNLVPWIFFVLVLPVFYGLRIKKYLHGKNIIKEIRDKKTILTILFLILIPLVSIIRVKTRIAWYAMPIYPFLLIYIAYNVDFLLERIKVRFLTYLVMILLAVEGMVSLNKEVNIGSGKTEVPPRYDIFIKARQYEQKEIDHLVWRPERVAEAILPKNMRTSTTFIYGGNPCAVYYSGKKVNYYYSTDQFKERLQNKKNSLFVIENGDLSMMDNLPVEVVYKNSSYTLFR